MKRKFFGLMALAAFAVTTGITAVNANVQENTIWVYLDGTTTTDTPDCLDISNDICAQRHEFNPETGEIGDALQGEQNIVRGERP